MGVVEPDEDARDDHRDDEGGLRGGESGDDDQVGAEHGQVGVEDPWGPEAALEVGSDEDGEDPDQDARRPTARAGGS